MGSSSLEDLRTLKFWAALFGEFIGTMLLVLVGCGSALEVGNVGLDIVRVALCFGFSVGTLVWLLAHVSGGHINPAVTLGLLASRKISIIRAVLYVAFQCLGAIVGAAILMGIVPASQRGTLATPGTNVSLGATVGVELMITFVLVITVFACVDGVRTDLNGSAPLTIGLSIAMCHLWAVPYTGSGMNPARVLGPAVVSGTWENHWAYWVGPIIGGVLAGWLYEFVLAANATKSKLRGFFTVNYDEDNYNENGLKLSITQDPESKRGAP